MLISFHHSMWIGNHVKLSSSHSFVTTLVYLILLDSSNQYVTPAFNSNCFIYFFFCSLPTSEYRRKIKTNYIPLDAHSSPINYARRRKMTSSLKKHFSFHHGDLSLFIPLSYGEFPLSLSLVDFCGTCEDINRSYTR